MKTASMKIGFWASLLQTTVGFSYIILYVILFVKYPIKAWTGIEDFALIYHGGYKTLLMIIQVLVFLQSLMFFTIMVVISESVTAERKTLAKIGVYCSVVFLTISSIHYYIQLTTVSTGISNGMLDGLNQLAQFNLDSPVSMINIMAWTLFFGIANITLAFCFESRSKVNLLRWGFLINGISCIMTFILYTLGWKSSMILWTVVLSITWYTYPMLMVFFRKGKLKLR